MTPSLVLITSAVRERIDCFKRSEWLTIDPGYEQHLSKWCYIRGGHVPFHCECLPCESPSSPANKCGPLARRIRGANWRSVCDVYCASHAVKNSTATRSSAPLEMTPPIGPPSATTTDISAVIPEHRDDVNYVVDESSLDYRYRPKTDELSDTQPPSERTRAQTGLDTHMLLLAVAIIVLVGVILALLFLVLLYLGVELPSWCLLCFRRPPLSSRPVSALDAGNGQCK